MNLLPSAVARGRYVVSPTINPKLALPFIQTIELFDGDKPIASASWFTTGNDGVVQLLDLRVSPTLQRRGVGRSVFRQVQHEARAFFKSRGMPIRRIICNVEQKTQITARAFFTGLGFHHVQTISNTLCNEDILVYLLGCD